jgi:membrane associated rhomboid family serine protease
MRGEGVAGFPLGTAVVLGLCVGAFVLQSAFQVDVSPFSIGAFPIVYGGEWYRIVSSAFLHLGVLHIGMNMMTLVAMGPSVEACFGTLQFSLLIVAAVLLEGLIYLFMSMLGWWLSSDPSWLHMYAVGFSGVLFTLAVEEASLSPLPDRSVFGLFRVPTRLYPWVLLILMQLVLGNVSFLGHLSGILVGVLHVGRMLSPILPSHEYVLELERSGSCRVLTRLPGCIPCPEMDPITVAQQRAGTASSCGGTVTLAFRALWEGVGPIVMWVWGGLRGCLEAVGGGRCLTAGEQCCGRAFASARSCCSNPRAACCPCLSSTYERVPTEEDATSARAPISQEPSAHEAEEEDAEAPPLSAEAEGPNWGSGVLSEGASQPASDPREGRMKHLDALKPVKSSGKRR